MLLNLITARQLMMQPRAWLPHELKLTRELSRRKAETSLVSASVNHFFFLFVNLGKEFDLMSRRMVSANNDDIAKRIIMEIEVFDVVRDDVLPAKK